MQPQSQNTPKSPRSDAAATLAAKGFWVFPVSPGLKKPAGKDWQKSATLKPNGEFSGGQNIGIFTEVFGPNRDPMVVVDIDVKNPSANGEDSVMDWLFSGRVLPDTFEVRTPSGGRHLFYKAPRIIHSSVGKLAKGIDIRGAGSLVVGPGSCLEDGKFYEISKDLPLADAPEWLVDACGRTADAYLSGKTSGAATDLVVPVSEAVSRSRQYLLHAKGVAEHDGRNDAAFRHAAMCRDFGLTDLDTLAELLDECWNCRNAPPLDREELVAAIRSSQKSRQNPVGIKSSLAAFDDMSKQSPAQERVAPPVAETRPLAKLNQECAFVRINGKHRIIYRTLDEYGMKDYALIEEGTFHAMHQSLEVLDKNNKPIPATKVWMKDAKRPTFQGLTFRPSGKAPAGFFNTWSGWRFTGREPEANSPEAKDAVETFLEHMAENVCDGDTNLFNYVERWIAHIVQTPEKRVPVALVVRGLKGTGKSFMTDTLQETFGLSTAVTLEKGTSLYGKFNSQLAKKMLICCEEAFWAGSKDAESVIKHLISGPSVMVEYKGLEQVPMANYARFVILGNEDWLIPASSDERRFCVTNINPRRREDKKYFGGIRDGMEAGGYARLFRHYAEEVELGNFHQIGAPNTAALVDQKIQSLPLVARWWFGFLQDSGLPGWPEQITRAELYSHLRTFAARGNVTSRLPPEYMVTAELQRFCPGLLETRAATGKGPIILLLPTLTRCREMFDAQIGGKMKWV